MGVQPREAARARSKFADGRLRLALTTERAHFFLRIRTRGVKARFLQIYLYIISLDMRSKESPSSWAPMQRGAPSPRGRPGGT